MLSLSGYPLRMHPRVEQLPEPQPDYRRFLAVLRRERPDRIPLIELAVHPAVVDVLLAEPPPASSEVADKGDSAGANGRRARTATAAEPSAELRRETARRSVRLHYRLGYDVVKISAPIPFNVARLNAADASPLGTGERAWTDEQRGPIAALADLERFPWPELADVDFSPVDAAGDALSPGMALIGFSGGVLEFAMDLLGMGRLFVATRRDPELVAAVIERVGRIIESVFKVYCRRPEICALWLGDDLGHKHGTLLSPAWLREHIVPWYRRFADLAHAHGRPFLLHTCGNNAAVMPDLVEAGIDAKHSFEDAIQPVERFMDEWGGRLATLGGVDVHLLASGEEAAIRRRVRQILAFAGPRGGYACGSGNSIPNYVPPASYLALLEEVAGYNAGVSAR